MPISMRTPEQAQQVANRRNKKNAKRWPLLALAGALETVTAEQILDSERKYRNSMAATNAMFAARGEEFRLQVAALVTAAALAKLDEQRKRYPSSPEYSADFWRGVLLKTEDKCQP